MNINEINHCINCKTTLSQNYFQKYKFDCNNIQCVYRTTFYIHPQNPNKTFCKKFYYLSISKNYFYIETYSPNFLLNFNVENTFPNIDEEDVWDYLDVLCKNHLLLK